MYTLVIIGDDMQMERFDFEDAPANGSIKAELSKWSIGPLAEPIADILDLSRIGYFAKVCWLRTWILDRKCMKLNPYVSGYTTALYYGPMGIVVEFNNAEELNARLSEVFSKFESFAMERYSKAPESFRKNFDRIETFSVVDFSLDELRRIIYDTEAACVGISKSYTAAKWGMKQEESYELFSSPIMTAAFKGIRNYMSGCSIRNPEKEVAKNIPEKCRKILVKLFDERNKEQMTKGQLIRELTAIRLDDSSLLNEVCKDNISMEDLVPIGVLATQISKDASELDSYFTIEHDAGMSKELLLASLHKITQLKDDIDHLERMVTDATDKRDGADDQD